MYVLFDDCEKVLASINKNIIVKRNMCFGTGLTPEITYTGIKRNVFVLKKIF